MEIQIHPNCLKELVIGSKKFRSPWDYRLLDADLEKSKRDLQETEEVREASLEKLKDMLNKDKEIIYRTDDEYLLRYLRYRKFNCKQAYKCIRNLYISRNEIPELFSIPLNLESVKKTGFFNMLPYTDEEGNLIFVHKWGNWDPNELTVLNLLNAFCVLSDILSMNPHAQINGIISIEDFENTAANQAYQLLHLKNLRLLKKVVQDLYPWRIKKIIHINCNTMVYTGLTVIRHLLKKKITEKFVVLGSDISLLHQYVNPAILPKEYGGCLENDCFLDIDQPCFENMDYLKYENSFIGKLKQ